MLLTCGRMICEAAFSRTGTSTNTNSKHSPSTTQTLTCLPWQGGQKLMTIIYPISDKVVNCNHLNGQPQQYLSICLSSSENYISTKFHYTACIMLLLVTTCEGSWRHGCLSKVPKYDSPENENKNKNCWDGLSTRFIEEQRIELDKWVCKVTKSHLVHMITSLRKQHNQRNSSIILLFGQQTEPPRSLSRPRNSHVNRRKIEE